MSNREREQLIEQMAKALADAVRAECTCGGRGDDDPEACQACMVWHRARRQVQELMN